MTKQPLLDLTATARILAHFEARHARIVETEAGHTVIAVTPQGHLNHLVAKGLPKQRAQAVRNTLNRKLAAL